MNWFSGCWGGRYRFILKILISNKFPGDVDAADWRPHLESHCLADNRLGQLLGWKLQKRVFCSKLYFLWRLDTRGRYPHSTHTAYWFPSSLNYATAQASLTLSVLFIDVSHWNVYIRKILMLKISIKAALLFKVIEPGLWPYVCKILCSILFSSVHSLSRVWFFVTPWTAACQAFLSITNCWNVLQLMSHRAGDVIQPSHPLSSPSPPAFKLSQSQCLFKWVSSFYQVAKILEFQLQHQSFQWIFRADFF